MKFGNKIVFIICFGLLVLDCGVHQIAGGDTSETGNTFIVGKVTLPSGEGMPRTQVMLIPETYNPVSDGPIPDSCIDTTDESGHYMFHLYNKEGKHYNLQAVQILQRTRTLVFGIAAGSDTTFVQDAVLKNSGTIRIIFSDNAGLTNGYLYAPGTTIFKSLVGADAQVALDSVPAGILPEVCYSTKNATAPTLLRYGVRVTSFDTAVVWNLGWNYCRTLTLNTTASGADVAGGVTDFPALVRLTSDNFDFTRARNNGEDIRFTKSDNTFLPYEIERWDPVAGRAEVWVRVDTVHGNDSAQTLMMYWGNPNAADESGGAAVFDTGKGFQGVWHLGETDSIASDATGNRYDGTGYFTSPAAGIIGNALHFNGNSSVIRMKATASSRLSFPINGRYAVSAWVFHDILADSVTYLVAGKGEHQYFIKNFDLELSIGQHARQWEFTEYHDNDWQSATFVPAIAKSWVYLVGVRDGSNEYLYVNGSLAMNKIFAADQGQLSQDTSDDFAIGGFLRPVTTYNQGCAYFSGVIDEVTVSSAPRSADWVKLNYMNQKENDMLVKW